MKNGELARIINHPHDHYFKNTFGKIEIARDFLKSYLPEDILEVMDLDTLTHEKGEYVDKKLKNFYTDLLYQVSINDTKGYIYILYEHKSYHDEKTIFQLMKYMAMVWDDCYDTKTKLIPPVIPVLIYHGERELQIKTRLWDMIESVEALPSSLKKMIPKFEFRAYDYSPKGKEPIKGTSLIQAVLWLLKSVREKNKTAFQKGYDKFVEQVQKIGETYGIEKAMEIYLITLVYIINTRDDITQEELQESLPEGGKIMETLAKQLFNKGEEKGIEKGIEKGLDLKTKKALINFYNKGLPIETIAEGLEITKEKALEIIKKEKENKKVN